MKYSTDTYFVKYELEMNVTANYATHTRVEECHGYHSFEDTNAEYIVNSLRIKIGDSIIDLTYRLTDAEKELLTENQDI